MDTQAPQKNKGDRKHKNPGSYWSNTPFAEKLAHLTNLPGSKKKKKKFKKRQQQ